MSSELQRAFFQGWDQLWRTVLITACAYVAMLLLIRAGGKRSLAQLNAYDLIVTVALGSTLASAILSPTTSVAQAAVAFAMLVGMQFLISFAASRSNRMERIVNGRAELVFHRGRFLPIEMRRHRLAREEILEAIRAAGHATIEEVEAVVFETNGRLSVLARSGTRPTALQDVRGHETSGRIERDDDRLSTSQI